MAANSQVFLASLSALGYATLRVVDLLVPLVRSGSLRGVRYAASNPVVWVTIAIALLVAWGLSRRYAWAWWLGVAAASYQLVMIAFAHGRTIGLGRLPGTWTLAAVALLVLLLVMLLPRRARMACSR